MRFSRLLFSLNLQNLQPIAQPFNKLQQFNPIHKTETPLPVPRKKNTERLERWTEKLNNFSLKQRGKCKNRKDKKFFWDQENRIVSLHTHKKTKEMKLKYLLTVVWAGAGGVKRNKPVTACRFELFYYTLSYTPLGDFNPFLFRTAANS